MTATAQTVTSAGVGPPQAVMYGTWTTAASEGIHTITLPRHVAFVCVHGDTGGTNPFLVEKFLSETDETLMMNGADGVISSPADAAGITITNNSDGTSTVAVAVEVQVNDGTNHWYAFVKA